jgi:hypothetical protein
MEDDRTMDDSYESRLAEAENAVEDKRDAIDRGLESAPDHTVGGIPVSPSSGLHPLEWARDEAEATLRAIQAEGSSRARSPVRGTGGRRA